MVKKKRWVLPLTISKIFLMLRLVYIVNQSKHKEKTMDGTHMNDLAEVERLAEEYASYSLSKGGLANVLGGIAGIVIYLFNGLLGRGIWTTVLTIALTLSWLAGKELLRTFLYRPFGEAREKWSQGQRRGQVWVARFFLLITVLFWFAFWDGYFRGTVSLIRLVLGLAVATSMPWVAWRYLHNMDEIMVGTFLLICCSLVSVGSLLGAGLDAWMVAAWMPIYALMLLWRGVDEHRRFLRLARQLQAQGETH
jgi:hypothetical protein